MHYKRDGNTGKDKYEENFHSNSWDFIIYIFNILRILTYPFNFHWSTVVLQCYVSTVQSQSAIYICCNLLFSHSGVSDILRPHGLQPARLLCPWDSLGRNAGVGSHSLLQGIFPTYRSQLGLLHCRWSLYCLSTREPTYTCSSFFFRFPSQLGHHRALSGVPRGL